MCRNRYSRSMRNGRFCFCLFVFLESGVFLLGFEIYIDKGSRINKFLWIFVIYLELYMEKISNFVIKFWLENLVV